MGYNNTTFNFERTIIYDIILPVLISKHELNLSSMIISGFKSNHGFQHQIHEANMIHFQSSKTINHFLSYNHWSVHVG